ncbi:hypothetical protein phytr_11620 [Candidatus Phycorickettsia trachydisci]|uniref:Nudix hydrolase domain-containing protein n=1 Tax=Candidatus Phycorickettsia trachydisci TaxID=2115978 RepID=A0A2P1P9Z2_9RICK|nr:NUDIX domain-containing protein [Candidatus Phycorickettsia trachydisci]AVP88087.1 hypothetical protein phytr_11620 [Candidatus Phycorickettsia trachydisci]
MTDFIDVLDEDGFRTGEVLSRKDIHSLGKLHRAVHLYLFDMQNNILLQRRTDLVDHYPGAISISVTGHIMSGEASFAALKREIKEELNLDADNLDIQFMFSFRQDKILDFNYIDRQFNDVYFCQHDFKLEEIKFNAQEVASLELMPFQEFTELVQRQNLPYKRAVIDLAYFLGFD